MKYTAKVKKNGKFYDISFPDAPGCVTFCKNKKDIESTAFEALVSWIKAETSRGYDIPTPEYESSDDFIDVEVPKDIVTVIVRKKSNS